MPRETHSITFGAHASLVVTRELLTEFLAVASRVGWLLQSCELTTQGKRQISIDDLADLSEVSAHVLESAKKVSLLLIRNSDGDRDIALLDIENDGVFAIGKPFSLRISGPREGQLLELRGRIAELVRARRQWYSALSRPIGYWIGYFVLINIYLEALLTDAMLHKSWKPTLLIQEAGWIAGSC